MNVPASEPSPKFRTTPDGIVVDLPRRELGKLRWIALPLLTVGLIFLGGVTHWILAAASFGTELGGNGGFPVVRLVFSLFGLLFVIPTLMPIGLGLAILAGRSSIGLTRRHVRRIERVGPFWWSRKRPAEKIRRFTVAAGPRESGGSAGESALATLSAIKVEFDKSSDWLLLAPGYPTAVLTEVAEALAKRWNQLTPARVMNDAGRRVEVVVEPPSTGSPTGASDDSPVAAQPPGSIVTVERTADGVVLHVPPAGLWQGSMGLFAFALIWNGFITVFVAIWLLDQGITDWKPAAFFSLFVAVGIAMLVGALKMGRRRARIETAGDAIRITVTDPFGTRTREWPYGTVAAVGTGPSGMQSNDVDILELQVHPAQGKKAGFLAGRDAEELRWMAAVLREQMGVPSTPKPKTVTAPG